MKLIHYDNKEIREIIPHPFRGREAERPMPYFKPIGLWVSIDGEFGWREWCLANDFGLDQLTHVHEVVLKPDAKILHLSDRVAILDFHKNYSFDLLAQLAPHHRDPGHTIEMIAWDNVAELYQGIIICPYRWDMELRFHKDMLWYNGWDCSSGCIWDHNAIESIKLIDVTPVPKPLYPDDSADDGDAGVDTEV